MTLIDRDALMDKINNTMASYVDLIMDAPIIKIPKWTSVTERLPETEGCYLCTVQDESVNKRYIMTAVFAHSESISGKNYWFPDDDHNYYKVIAWMPLPEIYKERTIND